MPPLATYCWWMSPSWTFWPTAPITATSWATSGLCATHPRITQCIEVVRRDAVGDGFEYYLSWTGDHMPIPIMPTPWMGAGANLRYAERILRYIAMTPAATVIKRMASEHVAWTRGNLMLAKMYLQEFAARTNTGVDEELGVIDRAVGLANAALPYGWHAAAGAAAATGPWGVVAAAAIELAGLVFGMLGQTPGTMRGGRGLPTIPGRTEIWQSRLGEHELHLFGPISPWAVPSPACEVAAPAANGAGRSSTGLLVLGGVLGVAGVSTVALALARGGR